MLDLTEYGIRVSFMREDRDANDRESLIEFVATVETPCGDFVTPWGVGVGHVKGYRPFGGYTIAQLNRFLRGIAEYKPNATDLIVHILVFSDVLDCTFSEWAENLGLSDDSISARRDYLAYQEQCMIIRRVLGDDFEKIREWAQEQ